MDNKTIKLLGLKPFDEHALEQWFISKLHQAKLIDKKLALIETFRPIGKLSDFFTPLGLIVYHNELHRLLDNLSKRFKLKAIVLILKSKKRAYIIPYNRYVRGYIRKNYKILLEADKFWVIKTDS